jgi:hypothetical protein
VVEFTGTFECVFGPPFSVITSDSQKYQQNQIFFLHFIWDRLLLGPYARVHDKNPRWNASQTTSISHEFIAVLIVQP